VSLGDVDGDGDLDAFVANAASVATGEGQPNKVWLNDGQGLFTDSGQNLGNSCSTDVALGYLYGAGKKSTFRLRNGVAIYGGFPSGGGAWEKRDPDQNETILSGDIVAVGDSNDNNYSLDATAVLDGFTITGGNAAGPEDRDKFGGGMKNFFSNQTVTNCVFTGNSASYGGGMHNSYKSSPSVTNCAFNANSAYQGGGIYNREGSNPILTNYTFSGNSTSHGGGGIWNYDSNPMIINCILWSNTPDEVIDFNSTSTITYSDVQGGWLGIGNINADPCFMNANNLDLNLWNLRLKPDSPCIDAGDTTAIPTGIFVDADGNPRVLDDPQTTNIGLHALGVTVDMGAYEFQPCRIPGDNNCDSVVDFKDLAMLCNNWLTGIE
jgi:hypothetical protein